MTKTESTAKYIYAMREDEKIVNIDDVTEADRKHKFYCIGCKCEMRPAIGKIREHHFRHKGDTCSYESYLHKLGKKVLKERFDSGERFEVEYYTETFCEEAKNCPFPSCHPVHCDRKGLHKFDLKEYYDICEEEVEYNGFRADLILKKQDKPERQPVFIEISVTHDCEEAKINSGIRIIELKVANELDLLRPLKEISEPPYDENALPHVRFYNFLKRKFNAEPKPLTRFWISKGSNGMIDAGIDTDVNCRTMKVNHHKGAFLETMMPAKENRRHLEHMYQFAVSLAYERGIKNCFLCNNIIFCTFSYNNGSQVEARQLSCKLKFFISSICKNFRLRSYGIKQFSFPHTDWQQEETTEDSTD